MAGSATLPALLSAAKRIAPRLPAPLARPPLPELPVPLEAPAPATGLWAMAGPFLAVGSAAFLLYGCAFWVCWLR